MTDNTIAEMTEREFWSDIYQGTRRHTIGIYLTQRREPNARLRAWLKRQPRQTLLEIKRKAMGK